MNKIRVLVADDIAQTRKEIQRLLYLEEGVLVVGEAADGLEAVRLAEALRPDLVLMDINMPVMDGITATEEIGKRCPGVSVVIISIQGEQEYLKGAMLAGARDYLVKPFSGEELLAAIRRVEQRKEREGGEQGERAGQVVAVMSPKGGVGKTTLASNLAVCLAQRGQRVALVDLDLEWGDVAAAFNLRPGRTLAELAREQEVEDREILESYLQPHLSGVRVLAAPRRPQDAEMVTEETVRSVLLGLAGVYDYTVVDTANCLGEINLQLIELARQILLVVNQDFLCLKNARLFLEVLEGLDCRERARVVLNRAEKGAGASGSVLSRTLGAKVEVEIPEDRRLVHLSLEQGMPLALGQAGSPVAAAIRQVAELLPGDGKPLEKDRQSGWKLRNWLAYGKGGA